MEEQNYRHRKLRRCCFSASRCTHACNIMPCSAWEAQIIYRFCVHAPCMCCNFLICMLSTEGYSYCGILHTECRVCKGTANKKKSIFPEVSALSIQYVCKRAVIVYSNFENLRCLAPQQISLGCMYSKLYFFLVQKSTAFIRSLFCGPWNKAGELCGFEKSEESVTGVE